MTSLSRTGSASFNNPRRSVALRQLVLIQSYGLLSDDELAEFSLETLESIRRLRFVLEG